ncbi:hypothetical protein [Streptomyces chartreusis]|uniref:hypothetical protein n=1 Tax=Streptomyces chartreusis TaxID=1969 RepID=UPI0033E560DC
MASSEQLRHVETQAAVKSLRGLASHFDREADHYRQEKKAAEVREIWFMNRASALREAADKVDRIAQDYAKQCEET